MPFFGNIGIVVIVAAVVLGRAPVTGTFIETGLVPRLPTAVLCVGLVVLGTLNFFTDLILDMITRARQEIKRLLFLSISRTSE